MPILSRIKVKKFNLNQNVPLSLILRYKTKYELEKFKFLNDDIVRLLNRETKAGFLLRK